MNTVQFYRTTFTPDNQPVTELFLNYTLDGNSVAVFEATVDAEGIYSCFDAKTNLSSTNNITLVGKTLLLSIQFGPFSGLSLGNSQAIVHLNKQ